MKINHLRPSTIAKMPMEFARLVSEWQSDYNEWQQNWGLLTASERKEFLKEYGKNGNFLIDHNEISVDFLKEEAAEIEAALDMFFPAAAKDWEGLPDEQEVIPEDTPKATKEVKPKQQSKGANPKQPAAKQQSKKAETEYVLTKESVEEQIDVLKSIVQLYEDDEDEAIRTDINEQIDILSSILRIL